MDLVCKKAGEFIYHNARPIDLTIIRRLAFQVLSSVLLIKIASFTT